MEHFLKEIEITNFKSIRHQKITGCKRINLFLGYPNVGKSNILEAIGSAGMLEYPRHLIGHLHMPSWIRAIDITNIFFDGAYLNNAIIEIDGNTRYRFEVEKRAFGETTTVSNLTDKQLLFHAELRNILGEYMSVREVSFKDAFLKGADIAYTGGLDFENAFHQIRPYLYQQYSSNNYFEFDVPYLLPNGENIIEIFIGFPSFRKEVSELFKRYNIKVVIDRSTNEIKLVKDTEDSLAYFIDYSLIADTLQRLIFYKAAIASNKNSVLIFEEPEAHMFPPYIKSLMWDVVQSETNQFFIATHSPFVLDTLLEEGGDEVMIYLVDFKDGETVVKGLSAAQIQEVKRYGIDLFFNMEDYLQNEEQSASL